MCCFVVWLTVFVRVRLFVGPWRHGLNGTGVALRGRPSNSTLAEKVPISFWATRSLLDTGVSGNSWRLVIPVGTHVFVCQLCFR
jgi:hypothetical protein